MPGQDRSRQERLLCLAGWLYNKHRFETAVPGRGYTEVAFTRDDLDRIPALASYGTLAGEAGERALTRDVGELRRFGIEIRYEAEGHRWLSRSTPLSDSECRALAVAALSVIVEDATPSTDGYRLPGAALTPAGAERIVSFAPVVDDLLRAIRDRYPVTLVHRGQERTIDPWRLFLQDGRWYVVGRDHATETRRGFGLDAVSAVSTAGRPRSFSIPSNELRSASDALFVGESGEDDTTIEVSIEVDRRLVTRAEALLGAERTSTTGPLDRVPMRCVVHDIDDFVMRLWGLRARVVVTAPLDVRQRAIDSLREMT